MLNTGLYQGRTKAASDTLPLAVRSLFASLKSEGKALLVPECSAGKTALVQGRSRPGFMEPFWDKWDNTKLSLNKKKGLTRFLVSPS